MSRRLVRLVTFLLFLSWTVSLLATPIWAAHEIEDAVDGTMGASALSPESVMADSDATGTTSEGHEEGIAHDTVHALAELATLLSAGHIQSVPSLLVSVYQPSAPTLLRSIPGELPFEPPRR